MSPENCNLDSYFLGVWFATLSLRSAIAKPNAVYYSEFRRKKVNSRKKMVLLRQQN